MSQEEAEGRHRLVTASYQSAACLTILSSANGEKERGVEVVSRAAIPAARLSSTKAGRLRCFHKPTHLKLKDLPLS